MKIDITARVRCLILASAVITAVCTETAGATTLPNQPANRTVLVRTAPAAVVPVGKPRPLPQVQLRGVAAVDTWRPTRIGPHVIYGQITALSGSTIRLRLRSGRLADVDARAAIAAGNYSAPLFVGKLVSVDGIMSTGGKFTASHVFRVNNLANLSVDH